jgi:hypothetical protein
VFAAGTPPTNGTKATSPRARAAFLRTSSAGASYTSCGKVAAAPLKFSGKKYEGLSFNNFRKNGVPSPPVKSSSPCVPYVSENNRMESIFARHFDDQDFLDVIPPLVIAHDAPRRSSSVPSPEKRCFEEEEPQEEEDDTDDFFVPQRTLKKSATTHLADQDAAIIAAQETNVIGNDKSGAEAESADEQENDDSEEEEEAVSGRFAGTAVPLSF